MVKVAGDDTAQTLNAFLNPHARVVSSKLVHVLKNEGRRTASVAGKENHVPAEEKVATAKHSKASARERERENAGMVFLNLGTALVVVKRLEGSS